MTIACKICIAKKGLRGCDIDSLFNTQDELNDHIEKVHHMVIVNESETEEEADARFIAKYPEARTCPDCIAAGAPWTKKQ